MHQSRAVFCWVNPAQIGFLDLGLRQAWQGGPFSPILYLIFIDGLVLELKKAPQGVLRNVKINILVFADDVFLLASSREELQQLLDI